jgi:hypothetical protein
MVTIIFDTGLMRAVELDGVPWNRKIAEEIKSEAVWTCPWGSSGTLRHSHGVEQNRVNGAFSAGFTVYNDARHAIWIHEGTGIYGPRATPIVPVNTEMRKYMHIPPHLLRNPWIWTNLRGSGKKKRSTLAADIDPWAHAESVDGNRANPWLRNAGYKVAAEHA